MNRTVRNGLAVATMAGGIFLLGSAVASASEGSTDASSTAVGDTTAVVQVDSSTNAEAGAEGHTVHNSGSTTAGDGGDGGSVVQAPVSSGVAAGSVHGDTTASSTAESTVVNTSPGGDGGSAAVSPVTTGDVAGGNASADGGGDTTATAESASTGGGSSTPLPETDAAVASSSSGGGTGGAVTEVDSSTNASGYAGGHYVSNHGHATAGDGGDGGSVIGAPVSSGTFCFAYMGDNHCTSSASSTITNTSPGGNGGNASVSPVTSGDVTGGNASANGGGSTTASAESLALGEFLQWLSGGGLFGSYGDGGAHTWVDSSTNASGSVYGHQVDNTGHAWGGNGGDGGSVIGAPVTSYVICFAWKGDNHCSSTATSTITNNSPGGKGGDASVSPVTGGDVTGGNACASSSSTPCPSATAPTHPAQPATPAQPAAPAQPAVAEHPAAEHPATMAVVHHAPAVSHSGGATTVNASSSSPATLAYTGADVTDALGLGLLALAGGLGLALAGRRRSAA